MSGGWKERLRGLGLSRRRRAHVEAVARPPRPSRAPTTRIGRAGEDDAVFYLESQGFVPLARNVRYPDGELDVVGLDGPRLVFVEVKKRRDGSLGSAAEAVTPRKRRLIVRAARRFLAENPHPSPRDVRFDVVAISDGGISWMKGAFDGSE